MEWKQSDSLVEYEQALSFMEERVAQMIAGQAEECVWFVEHPPLYTGGTSAQAADLLQPEFPVYDTGRGGEYTYHGPGQRVVYAMLDVKQRHDGAPDLKRYVWQLEEWVIRTLAELGVVGERREGRVGIWVVRDHHTGKLLDHSSPSQGGGSKAAYSAPVEQKIAAIGIRVRRWMSFHGLAINVNPDLSHYAGIVPCGIREHGVTSLHDLGVNVTLDELDAVLKKTFDEVF